MTDHNPLMESSAGLYATARRGRITPDEIAFIQKKADQGVRAANIARMIGRSVTDVRAWMSALNPPAQEAPKLSTQKQPRVVLSLWRGLITTYGDIPDGERAETKRELVERICWQYGITVEDVRGPSRVRGIARARQHVMYEMVEAKRWSLPQIGMYLGGRDHATVLHGYRRHAQRLAEARKLAA